jgi:hypothetical protein
MKKKKKKKENSSRQAKLALRKLNILSHENFWSLNHQSLSIPPMRSLVKALIIFLLSLKFCFITGQAKNDRKRLYGADPFMANKRMHGKYGDLLGS